MENFIYLEVRGRKEKYYLSFCPSCKQEKGYVRKSRINQLCRICAGFKVGTSNLGRASFHKGKTFSEDVRHKMSTAKKGHVPWNKGKKETRPEVKLKQALAKVGRIPWNKGNGNNLATDEIKNKVRHMVRRYIKGAPSSLWLKDIIGLSQEELRLYLESRFQPGMAWENWTTDGWHLDHIKPLAAFDLNNPEELKKACHYTNLQPLWSQENLSKSSKR